MRDVIKRWNTIPFETLIACLAVYGGLAGLLNVGTSTDALDVVVGDPLTTGLQILYLASGLGMLYGLGTGKARVEAPSVVGLIVSVLIRGVAVITLAGFSQDTSGLLILYALIAYFASVRVLHLVRGDVVVLLRRKDFYRSEDGEQLKRKEAE